MRLVERHVIKRTDPRFGVIDRTAFASKNLYNKALYATRQAFFQDGTYPSYPTLYHQVKGEPEYAALPPQGRAMGAQAGVLGLGQLQRGTIRLGSGPLDVPGPTAHPAL